MVLRVVCGALVALAASYGVLVAGLVWLLRDFPDSWS